MLLSVSTQAQTVTSGADSGPGSLRDEIDNATAGSVISFGVGVVLINLDSAITINKNLTITNSGLLPVVIDGGENGRIFTISGGVVSLDNLELTNGLADDGGAIYITNATVTISDCDINNNVANGVSGSGGGIYNDVGGDLTIMNTIIENNQANRAGGGIEDNSGAGLGLRLIDVNLDNNNTGVAPATANPGNGGGLHITGMGDVEISGGTVNGNIAASEGGGLWNGSGTMSLDSITIDGNSAEGAAADNGGGGIFNNGGTLNIGAETNITNNLATGASGSGGGLLSTDGAVTISDANFADNSANRAGGGIELIDGTLSVTNTDLTGNDVNGGAGTANPGNGGAFHVTGMASIVTFTNCIIDNNEAASEGGGLWNQSGTTMTVMDSEITGNTAFGDAADNGGGGIFNNGGTLNLEDGSELSNNLASGTAGSGGGLFSTDGDVTIDDVTFEANAANRAGGGIEIVDGTLDITYSDLINNDVNGTAGIAAPGNGGALHVTGNSTMVTIMYSNVNGNAAAAEGGGLWNQSGSTMMVEYSTVDDNGTFSGNTDDGGAGIFNNGGMLHVTASTVSNNDASGASSNGGGIYNITTGKVWIMRSTISGNTASSGGGGVYNDGDTVSINAVTIVNNVATDNGGGVGSNGVTILTNTLVSDNTGAAGDNVAGSLESGDYNLIATDDLNDFDAMSNDTEGTTPSFGPLQDNGGPTFTHALDSGSPGVDMGDPTATFTDQRNASVVGARDIGAFEFGGTIIGVEDVEVAIGKVYPNPVKNILVIEMEQDLDGSAHLMNMAGEVLQEVQLSGNMNNTVDVSQYPEGMYLLKLTSAGGVYTHKVLVAR